LLLRANVLGGQSRASNTQRRQAEMIALAALAFPWPGLEIPSKVIAAAIPNPGLVIARQYFAFLGQASSTNAERVEISPGRGFAMKQNERNPPPPRS